MKDQYDCIVIGGGPAGATAAALVAEGGFDTLLVERDKVPRFHVGESLMPEVYWTLQRLGVLDQIKVREFRRKNGVQFVGPSGKESQPFYFDQHDPRECAQTWHVERAEFDQLLFETARERGAECHDETRVTDVQLRTEGPHQVSLRRSGEDEQTVEARVIVDATGQQALLANRMQLKSEDRRLRKAAIWGHFRGAQRQPDGEPEVTAILHTNDKRCWFWYIPLAGDTVSVGLVGDKDFLFKDRGAPDAVFCEEAGNCPGLLTRLSRAELVGELHVAREFSYSSQQRAGEGWVLVGDAYGFIDPIYSTGVFLALRSAELAADSILEGLKTGDLSAQQLGSWTADFEEGVTRFRKLVDAFYTDTFSFARFLADHPEHQRNLTDLLIGRAFTPQAAELIRDLDQAVAQAAEQP